ncbi:hypothetical protein [Moorena sp. SIO4G3]|uniref:hypothetical protein n=1 Tax=Moorena sp. SIO4G3 TaxID=2607821 RepID=UPI00142AE50D|nr:hypothetical protein [Moorena sp. SIO4G3]NEO76551.1 hypothetical protein [Moorena sp. SIO4G3]
MSDGMAFLTGAAFAGMAALFLLKGGGNMVANNLPSSQPFQISPNNPYNSPYTDQPPNQALASPNLNNNLNNILNVEQQRRDTEQLKTMVEQQRAETEQLKAQLHNQQLLLDNLTAQVDASVIRAPEQLIPNRKPNNETANTLMSGILWGLGGMAVTIGGGAVVIGGLALLSRPQRPPRTTYVVQHPYSGVPPSLPARRRSEFMSHQYDDRLYDRMDYD